MSTRPPFVSFAVASTLAKGGLLLAALGLGACAQDVGDIDRTQANLLPKALLIDGQWFARQTVIDVPATSVGAFTGIETELEMIRWEIQEDLLIGYLAYEILPGADPAADPEGSEVNETPVGEGKGQGNEPEEYKGEPWIAFRIEDHVDVKRGYNPATGEQTNVIMEDTQDRLWYEREYVRVDWTQPVVGGLFRDPTGATSFDGAFWVQNQETSRDAFRLETAPGEPWDGKDPTAVTYMDMVHRLGLNREELEIRTSFLKVDVERERGYAPLVYDDERMGEFGYFRTERDSYDRRRGVTHTGRIKLAQRHDLWEQSQDEDGFLVPYEERRLRPVVYALSPDFPTRLLPVAEEVRREWDETFKETIAATRGQTIEALEDDLVTQTGDRCLFCLDENEDGHAQLGDIRYNFISWIEQPQTAGLLGFGPSSAHPETGRIVTGSAHVYGGGVDTLAQFGKDIVDLLNGELTEQDIMDVEVIRRQIADRRAGIGIDPRGLAVLDALQVGAPDAQERLLGPEAAARLEALRTQGLPEAEHPTAAEDRLAKLRGTELEHLAYDDELLHVLRAKGHDVEPGDPLDRSLLDLIAPDQTMTAAAASSHREREAHASANSVWLREFSDPSVVGLALEAKERGLSGDELYHFIREQVFKAVMLHELGHTVGLRHNFSSSADALNYHEEYWPLRVQSLPEATELTGADLLRMNCSLRTEENRAACEAQDAGRMREYAYSSIMDYGGKFNSDFHGLGRYDRAAIAAGYGDLVEVFDEAATAAMPSDLREFLGEIAEFKNPLFGSVTDNFHYTSIPSLLGGVENLGRRRLVSRSAYVQGRERGEMVRVPYMACYDEYVDATSTCHRWDEGADAYEIATHFTNTYREYYVFNNFQRDRVGYNPFNTFVTVLNRYFLPTTNMYQHWLFDNLILDRGDSISQFYAELGALEGFNMLWNVMVAPEPGTYQLVPETGTYELVSYSDVRNELPSTVQSIYVPAGEGRRINSRYDYDSGYYLFDRVLETGNFWDQRAAIIALTSNDARALGIGTDIQADALRYSIPYYLVFQPQLDELFGGIFGENNGRVAPAVDANGVLIRRDAFAGPPLPGDPGFSGYIRPGINFSTRIQSLINGALFFKSNFNLSFVQRLEVVLAETASDRAVPPGFVEVTGSDFYTGRTYVAYRPSYDDGETWFAADLVGELAAVSSDIEASQARLVEIDAEVTALTTEASDPATTEARLAEIEAELEVLQAERAVLLGFLGDTTVRSQVSAITEDLEMLRAVYEFTQYSL